MKTFMTALGLVAFLFVQAPVAEAVTFQEVKEFLFGGGSDRDDTSSSTSLLQATALQSLTTKDLLSIHDEGKVLKSENVASFGFEIREGDTLWDRIENELTVSFPSMSKEQKYYTTDRILDEMRSLSASELQKLGVSSGNIDLIFPDESVVFSVEITKGDTDVLQVDLGTPIGN